VVTALVVADLREYAFLALLLGLVVLGWLWWLIGRQVAAIGYADRADDLLVVSGIIFRRLVVVPYGRMQLVDVRRGPIERYLGLATVQLHTAAATTDATVPGLPPDEAGRLRDRLAALGEQRSAGL
jgi:membrane protein YdbS with pleckstrin-like domain